MNDEFYMRRALRLARRAIGRTSPNPMVGAVLVKDGKIISEGYHKRAGEPHAEAIAIKRAMPYEAESLNGATLYVSLEPCCHTEKRTPPCTKAIINAGIKRVVIAHLDPNPKVSGRGVEELRRAGIEVVSGVLEKEATLLNEAYIKYIKTGMPFVILKTAMSLDGKIATAKGESKWITGQRARLLVHRLRSRVDAVLTAIGTVKADDPELTSRIRHGKDPIRIVIDPEFETPKNSKILKTPPRTIIVTKKEVDLKGVEFIRYKGRLDLQALMKELAKMEIMSIMVEGGSSLSAHCLEEGIVDKVMFFIAPKIIGGKNSYPAIGGSGVKTLSEAYKIRDMRARHIGEDILIEGYIDTIS